MDTAELLQDLIQFLKDEHDVEDVEQSDVGAEFVLPLADGDVKFRLNLEKV